MASSRGFVIKMALQVDPDGQSYCFVCRLTQACDRRWPALAFAACVQFSFAQAPRERSYAIAGRWSTLGSDSKRLA